MRMIIMCNIKPYISMHRHMILLQDNIMLHTHDILTFNSKVQLTLSLESYLLVYN